MKQPYNFLAVLAAMFAVILLVNFLCWLKVAL